MKSLFILLILTVFAAQVVNSQIAFEQIIPPEPAPQILPVFEGVSQGSIAFADIDGDNDQDVLITGYKVSNQPIAKLYTNDGTGNYTEVTGTPFEGVYRSSIAFADVDGINGPDILITGQNASNQPIAKLYTNDGVGNYTEATGTPFDGVSQSSIAFADVDGDFDHDVLITGVNAGGQSIAKLYTNNGVGTYTEVTATTFIGVSAGSIAFSDIDGDSDQDVVMTGADATNQPKALVYKNDGAGNFALITVLPYGQVSHGSIAFADVDGDNDQDVIVTGDDESNEPIAKLFANNGTGFFTEVTGTAFDGVNQSSIAFANVDGINGPDVLITGRNESYQRIAKLYTNDGAGNYTLVTGSPFDGVVNSSIAFADVNGDNYQDVVITGENGSNQWIAKLYINDGVGNYTEVTGTSFGGVKYGSIAFEDVDGDSNQDVLITGFDATNQPTAKLYSNDGTGNYTEIAGTPFVGISQGSVAFADVDGDTDQDILITGYNAFNQPIAKLYSNNGTGNYTEVTGTPFESVYLSSIAFADVDGDTDQDVFISGFNAFFQPIAKLYANNGTGIYTEVTGTPFEGVHYSSIAIADVDGDNDSDVLITGHNIAFQPIAKLYTNDGVGNYTEATGTPFEGVSQSSIAFADVDGDTDQDVLITGVNAGGQSIAKLYANNGVGTYTEIIGTPFEGISVGSIAFADVDGDSDKDVLISGYNEFYQRTANLYANDGTGAYTVVTGTPFDGVLNSSIAFANMDGDNDPDVLITGENTSYLTISKAYRNITPCSDATTTDVVESCGSYVWRNGQSYTTSTTTETYIVIDAVGAGCDSIYTLNLTINQPNTGDTTAVACGSFDWYGNTYTSSAIPTHTFTNMNGCDSVVTLNLTINQPNTGDTTAVACGSFDWYGNTYTSSATPTHTFTNMNGCDSVVTLNLTINQPNTGDTTAVACGSFDWYGTDYTASGTPTHTFTNVAGCDSVVTLNLTINSVSDVTTTLVGATITANNASATSYQWLDCDNGNAEISTETAQVYTPSSNGSYSVEITENGCVDTSDCVTILTVGWLDNALGEIFSVYPNPTDGQFSIVFESLITELEVSIVDVMGKLVSTEMYTSVNKINLEINEPAGVYYVELSTRNGQQSIKVVKK